MKKSISGLLITDSMLNDLAIKEIIHKDGAAGMGLLVFVSMYLKKCFHAIGFMNDVQFFSNDVKKTVNGVKKWIRESDAFVVDEENGVFYMPLLRKTLKLGLCPSARELDVVQKYGNKIKKEPEEYTAAHPVESVKRSPADVCAMTDEASTDEKLLADEEKVFEKRNSQYADNKTDTNFSTNTSNSGRNRSKGIGIIRKGNNTTIPTTINTQQAVSDADDAEKSFKFFEEKILEAAQWRKSVSVSLGINLEDDDSARFFAKWMHDFCIAKNKFGEIRGEKGILVYAANLLTQGLRTRKCFDEAYRRDFLHESPSAGRKKHREEKHVFPVQPTVRVSYEELRNGRRIGMEGQVLPTHAPRQYNINERWSYIQDCYVDKSVWDRQSEEAARLEFERKQKEKAEQERRTLEEECRRDRLRQESDADDPHVRSVGEIIEHNILPSIAGGRSSGGQNAAVCCMSGDDSNKTMEFAARHTGSSAAAVGGIGTVPA